MDHVIYLMSSYITFHLRNNNKCFHQIDYAFTTVTAVAEKYDDNKEETRCNRYPNHGKL